MKLTRQRTLENAGSRTLFFTTAHIGRRRHSDFFSPSQVPEFEGESAWFEAEQVPKMGWRILRRVTEHGQPYEDEKAALRAAGPDEAAQGAAEG